MSTGQHGEPDRPRRGRLAQLLKVLSPQTLAASLAAGLAGGVIGGVAVAVMFSTEFRQQLGATSFGVLLAFLVSYCWYRWRQRGELQRLIVAVEFEVNRNALKLALLAGGSDLDDPATFRLDAAAIDWASSRYLELTQDYTRAAAMAWLQSATHHVNRELEWLQDKPPEHVRGSLKAVEEKWKHARHFWDQQGLRPPPSPTFL